jgi:integrase
VLVDFKLDTPVWWARPGVPVKTAQSLLGHKTIAMTMQVYSHVLLPDQAVALAGALPRVETQTATRAATSA